MVLTRINACGDSRLRGLRSRKPIGFRQWVVHEAIIYFTGLEEYFPLANLYYAKQEYDIAFNCIQHGIDKALLNDDIRMVENFCKLGQAYDLLKIGDIQDILKRVDQTIEKRKSHPIYGLLLTKSYHLKAAISQNNSKAKLEITINTNIDGENFELVSKLCSDIDNIITSLMPNKLTTEYQLSHNSPFELIVICIGVAANLVTIAGPIYQIISNYLEKNTKLSTEVQDYIKRSNSMYIESLNNQVDSLEQALRNTKRSKHEAIIKEFRGKLITTATEQIDKDLSLLVSQSSKE